MDADRPDGPAPSPETVLTPEEGERLKARVRKRRSRSRKKDGKIVVRIVVDEIDSAATAMVASYLALEDENDRRKLAGAIERIWSDLCRVTRDSMR